MIETTEPNQFRLSLADLMGMMTLAGVVSWLAFQQPAMAGDLDPHDPFWRAVVQTGKVIPQTLVAIGLWILIRRWKRGIPCLQHSGHLILLGLGFAMIVNLVISSSFGLTWDRYHKLLSDGGDEAGLRAMMFRTNLCRTISSGALLIAFVIGVFYFKEFRWRCAFVTLAVQRGVGILQIVYFRLIFSSLLNPSQATIWGIQIALNATVAFSAIAILFAIGIDLRKAAIRDWLHYFGLACLLIGATLPLIIRIYLMRYVGPSELFRQFEIR